MVIICLSHAISVVNDRAVVGLVRHTDPGIRNVPQERLFTLEC
jgi:hypothetical protein